ncbi:MAG: hypothetical protein QOD71_340 [Thermoleophilaceae bacterium]|jgi:hypothetical protein|nr:hypothetical protein [Thermoleophilaceae bacterium]
MRFISALALLAAVVAVAAPGASAAGPVATASKTCSVGDSRSYGTTYVLAISVSNTSCRAGRKVIRAFHACRPGDSGKCGSVKGYSCSEKRFNKSRTSYDSKVTCHKGDKTVKHTYTQFI